MLVNTKVWKEQEFAFLCFLFIEGWSFSLSMHSWTMNASTREVGLAACVGYHHGPSTRQRGWEKWRMSTLEKHSFLVVISTTFSGDMLIFRRGMFLMFTHLFRKWSDSRICSLKLKPRILVYKILPNSSKTTNFRYTPHPVTVTTRIIPFLVGNPGIPN